METADGPTTLNRTLDSLVGDRLRQWIINGQLQPGTRLVETTLAAQLGTSRGPVREAIRMLEHEGFVTVLPRRGARVVEVSVEGALDIYDLRIALEGVASRLAAQRRSADDVERICAVLEEGEKLIRSSNWTELGLVNNQFHQAVAEASRNRELLRLRVQYDHRFTWIFSQSARERGREAWSEHHDILTAITAGDYDQAGELAENHIQRSRDAYMAHVGVSGV